jgi:hypothetical protein
MTFIYDWLKRLFAREPRAETDEQCPFCHGLGYDSSGWTCTCLRDKK